MSIVSQNFDRAASRYDQAASLQAQVAEHLVALAAKNHNPKQILDLGCGTGFVTQAARCKWPQAAITAFDVSPAMLQETQRKIPGVKTISGNAAEANFPPAFDLIFASMMLQWLPDPHAALERWQGWLKPGGCLYAALPVEGSLQQWRATCRGQGAEDGLWFLPAVTFADDIAAYSDVQNIEINYSSAQEFLRRLKTIGASTSRSGHRPVNPCLMRRILTRAPRPFPVTWRVLYLKLSSRDSA